ncbi:MAG: hypothetical protein ACEY3E_05380 [Candidatus Tisiphia sp.]
MSKNFTTLERLSNTVTLLKNKIDKIERAKKLFATDITVHEILKAADLEECYNFVENTGNRLTARWELKLSLGDLHTQQSTLSKYKTVNCRKFEELSDQIHKIIQARKLLKCIDQHDFKEALKIAGLSYIIKKGAPGITRIWITENTFFENLDKYLEDKQKEYKIILAAYQVERGPSAPEPLLSNPLEGSSNCNNTYVTNNNHPAADSAHVPPLNQPLYSPKKLAPPPPPYEAANDSEYLLGVADHYH